MKVKGIGDRGKGKGKERGEERGEGKGERGDKRKRMDKGVREGNRGRDPVSSSRGTCVRSKRILCHVH